MNGTTLELPDLILRIVVGAALGGLVGLEREFSDQPAGFRTHILVSLGSTLFTLAGAYGVEALGSGDIQLRLDPTRVAAQIVTGIGFLGAGAIIQQGVNVRGLTTAAALWVTAAIGMAVGFGYWAAAVTTAVVTVLALYSFKQLERGIFARFRRGRHRVVIGIGPALKMATLAEILESYGGRIEKMSLVSGDLGERRLVGTIWLPPSSPPEMAAQDLRAAEGVERIEWTN